MPTEPEPSDSGGSRKAWRNPAVVAAAVAALGTVITLDLHGDKIGEQNCIYVISVTTQQYENIESNLNGNNFTLQLPGSIDHVSARACEKRAY